MRLFRKKIEKRCAYCAHGSAVSEAQVVCTRRGVVSASGHCFRFAYDPLKRTPPRPAALAPDAYRAEDFQL